MRSIRHLCCLRPRIEELGCAAPASLLVLGKVPRGTQSTSGKSYTSVKVPCPMGCMHVPFILPCTYVCIDASLPRPCCVYSHQFIPCLTSSTKHTPLPLFSFSSSTPYLPYHFHSLFYIIHHPRPCPQPLYLLPLPLPLRLDHPCTCQSAPSPSIDSGKSRY